MKRYAGIIYTAVAAFAALAFASAFASAVSAAQDAHDAPEPAPLAAEAPRLTGAVTATGDTDVSLFTDGVEKTYAEIGEGGSVTVTADGGIAALYVLFDTVPGDWTLSPGQYSPRTFSPGGWR